MQQMPSGASAELRRETLLAAGLLALFLLLLFWPGLNYPFLNEWDDGNFILFNKQLGFSADNFLLYGLQPFQDLYTPLPMYSFMVDRVLFGLDPLGYRLHNLLLHFTGCFFLFLIIRRLGARAWLAFAAALLWAANPQKVESVIWITERKDVLCGAFAFSSLWFFLRGVSMRKTSYMAGILAVLAIFAKPAAVPLPGVMIVGLICLRGARMPVGAYCRILGFPVLAALAAILWSGFVTAKTNMGEIEVNVPLLLHNFFWYPLTSLIPYETNPIYPVIRGFGPAMLPVAAGALAAGLYAVLARWARLPWRRIVCLGLIVAGVSLPVSGLLHYTDFHYCDRYNYLVSGVVWSAAALLAEAAIRRRKIIGRYIKGGAAAAFVLFWFLTWNYIPYWENSAYLYAYSISRDRVPNFKALGNGAWSALHSGNSGLLEEISARLQESHAEYGITAAQADMTARFFRAHIAFRQQPEKGAALYCDIHEELKRSGSRDFIWHDLTLPILFRDLAVISAAEGDKGRALTLLGLEVQVRKKGDPEYHVARSMMAGLKGDLREQLEELEVVVALEPENPEYRQFFEQLKLRVENAPH